MASESRLGDLALRLRVRQLIQNNRLPVVTPKRILAGYGTGEVCAVCGQPITNTQVEYDIEDASHDGRLIFHMRCHAIWQLECALRTEYSSGSQPTL